MLCNYVLAMLLYLSPCFFSVVGFFSHSAIIGGNAVYQNYLYQFLTPAVGLNSEWVLCYRASTHGWAASTFHSRCDWIRHTVTIIKVGVYVFGGYTDIHWGMINFFFTFKLIT